ncbi:MAG TPA: hypothetical protein VII69_04405 [Candidatus Eremiobacteraceae bacterium]
MTTLVRPSALGDRPAIRRIYNQGIAERCTLGDPGEIRGGFPDGS